MNIKFNLFQWSRLFIDETAIGTISVSWPLVSHGCLLLIWTLCGLVAEVSTPLRLRIVNWGIWKPEIEDRESQIARTYSLSLCWSVWFATLGDLLERCYLMLPLWYLTHSLLSSSTSSCCAEDCCVDFHSWVQKMCYFCSPSTGNPVSNNWNTVGPSRQALIHSTSGQSDLLDKLSMFILFLDIFTTPSPKRVLSVLKGTFEVLRFAWVVSGCYKGTRLRLNTAVKFISVKRRIWVCLQILMN